MLTRRKFVSLLSLGGIASAIGCSDKSTAPVSTSLMTPAAPMPDPTPAPPPPPSMATTPPANAGSTLPMLDVSSEAAKSLGYVEQASQADKVKFKTYVAGQRCGTCSLYQGKPNSTTGPCAIFPDKQVTFDGWCSAFATTRA